MLVYHELKDRPKHLKSCSNKGGPCTLCIIPHKVRNSERTFIRNEFYRQIDTDGESTQKMRNCANKFQFKCFLVVVVCICVWLDCFYYFLFRQYFYNSRTGIQTFASIRSNETNTFNFSSIFERHRYKTSVVFFFLNFYSL